MIGSQNCPFVQFRGSAEPIPAPNSDRAAMGAAAATAMLERLRILRIDRFCPTAWIHKPPLTRHRFHRRGPTESNGQNNFADAHLLFARPFELLSMPHDGWPARRFAPRRKGLLTASRTAPRPCRCLVRSFYCVPRGESRPRAVRSPLRRCGPVRPTAPVDVASSTNIHVGSCRQLSSRS